MDTHRDLLDLEENKEIGTSHAWERSEHNIISYDERVQAGITAHEEYLRHKPGLEIAIIEIGETQRMIEQRFSEQGSLARKSFANIIASCRMRLTGRPTADLEELIDRQTRNVSSLTSLGAGLVQSLDSQVQSLHGYANDLIDLDECEHRALRETAQRLPEKADEYSKRRERIEKQDAGPLRATARKRARKSYHDVRDMQHLRECIENSSTYTAEAETFVEDLIDKLKGYVNNTRLIVLASRRVNQTLMRTKAAYLEVLDGTAVVEGLRASMTALSTNVGQLQGYLQQNDMKLKSYIRSGRNLLPAPERRG